MASADDGALKGAERPSSARFLNSHIPFVEPEIPDKPFADVASRGGVDRPEIMLEGWSTGFEAAVGRYVTSPAGLLDILAARKRAVAIISCRGTDFLGRDTEWCGTGFLVAKNLFLTNHHVINAPQVASDAIVEFNFEATAESLLEAGPPRPGPTQRFKLDPSRLFVTSPAREGLDYSFIWIDGDAEKAFGSIRMERGSFTAEQGMQTFIIHHPMGEAKTVSLDDTEVLGITTRIIHYGADTKEGSSGAPVFDPRGRLIALHHASRRQEVALQDGGRSNVVNEGIKIAAIALDLENRMRAGGAEAADAQTVLKEIGGSDTMAGFFGALGRNIPSASHEVVRETYMGTDQDIDLGFWNVENMSAAVPDHKKTDEVAQVVADLNFDLWGLPLAAPAAVGAVVERIADKYGEGYRFDCARASPGGAGTALLWKTSVLDCGAVGWPSRLEPLLREDILVPGRDAPRRIFDIYPGLFRVRTVKDMPRYVCHVVLCGMDGAKEGARSRLAARILARALEDLVRQEDTDIVLCAGPGSAVSARDLAFSAELGYSVLDASKEEEGRMILLKHPKSGIDDIFLSPGMSQSGGAAAGVTVTRSLDLSEFVKGISQRSPIAMRMSLARRHPQLEGAGDLDAVIENLLARVEAGSSDRRDA